MVRLSSSVSNAVFDPPLSLDDPSPATSSSSPQKNTIQNADEPGQPTIPATGSISSSTLLPSLGGGDEAAIENPTPISQNDGSHSSWNKAFVQCTDITNLSDSGRRFFIKTVVTWTEKTGTGKRAKVLKRKLSKTTDDKIEVLSLTRADFIPITLDAQGLRQRYMVGPHGPRFKAYWAKSRYVCFT
jgi:hypothetical protein